MQRRIGPLLIVFSPFVSSCEEKQVEPNDPLDQIGILGKWKLDSRSVNNISDLSVMCCDYLTFSKSGSNDDLMGHFIASGAGYENDGEFELNTSLDSIAFTRENEVLNYGVLISGERMTYFYQEDGDSITEWWVMQP